MCNKEGLRIDSAGLRIKLGSHMDKTVYEFRMQTEKILATKKAPSTSFAPFDMQWSWFKIWSNQGGSDTGYGFASMAREQNSKSVKRYNHNK